MSLARQWYATASSLPGDWGDLRLLLHVDDPDRAERANAVLAPLSSSRHGADIRFSCSRVAGPGMDAVRRLLGRLDGEGVTGKLEVVGVVQSEPQPPGAKPSDLPAGAFVPPSERRRQHHPEALASQWDRALTDLPPDWSDLLAEIEIDSSDLLDRVALLMGPLNPSRDGERLALRFRCARSFGYGAAAGMVQRCLERVDGEGVPGRFTLLRALADTKPVYTQGPVWYVGGKAV